MAAASTLGDRAHRHLHRADPTPPGRRPQLRRGERVSTWARRSLIITNSSAARTSRTSFARLETMGRSAGRHHQTHQPLQADILSVVAALEIEGLIRGVQLSSTGAGRTPIVYEHNPGSAHVVGIDLGGTKIMAGLADLRGRHPGRGRGSDVQRGWRCGRTSRLAGDVASWRRAGVGCGSGRRRVGWQSLVSSSLTARWTLPPMSPDWVPRRWRATCGRRCGSRSSSTTT